MSNPSEKKQPHLSGAEPERQDQKQPNNSPPTSLADIPGLGIIRVRALKKAGICSLADLKNTSLEKLIAIPGMSEIKANSMQEYLANFDNLPTVEIAPESKKNSVVEAELYQCAVKIQGRIIQLLLKSVEEGLRQKLLKELSAIASWIESEISAQPSLNEKKLATHLNRLQCAEGILSNIRDISDKKVQARIAEELANIF